MRDLSRVHILNNGAVLQRIYVNPMGFWLHGYSPNATEEMRKPTRHQIDDVDLEILEFVLMHNNGRTIVFAGQHAQSSTDENKKHARLVFHDIPSGRQETMDRKSLGEELRQIPGTNIMGE